VARPNSTTRTLATGDGTGINRTPRAVGANLEFKTSGGGNVTMSTGNSGQTIKTSKISTGGGTIELVADKMVIGAAFTSIVTAFTDGDQYRWGSLMAGALVGSLPLVILYAFFVEHYVSAMTGAVKE